MLKNGNIKSNNLNKAKTKSEFLERLILPLNDFVATDFHRRLEVASFPCPLHWKTIFYLKIEKFLSSVNILK